MRALPLISTLFIIAAGAAQAASLRISGTAGYLSEWELNGEVIEKKSGEARELSGPLVWKHVGLCSVNGPQEKAGAIDLRIIGSGSSSHINGAVWLEGARCELNDEPSGASSAHMDCSSAKGIPITLRFE